MHQTLHKQKLFLLLREGEYQLFAFRLHRKCASNVPFQFQWAQLPLFVLPTTSSDPVVVSVRQQASHICLAPFLPEEKKVVLFENKEFKPSPLLAALLQVRSGVRRLTFYKLEARCGLRLVPASILATVAFCKRIYYTTFYKEIFISSRDSY